MYQCWVHAILLGAMLKCIFVSVTMSYLIVEKLFVYQSLPSYVVLYIILCCVVYYIVLCCMCYFHVQEDCLSCSKKPIDVSFSPQSTLKVVYDYLVENANLYVVYYHSSVLF